MTAGKTKGGDNKKGGDDKKGGDKKVNACADYTVLQMISLAARTPNVLNQHLLTSTRCVMVPRNLHTTRSELLSSTSFIQ
jgi:hypothetical protein